MKINADILKAIEFATISRMDLESGEQCTIVASPKVIEAIKIAIAKQEIFKDIYSRIILQENPEAKDEELLVVPDSIINKAIDAQVEAYIEDDSMQEKLAEMSKKFEHITDEQWDRIANVPEDQLTEDELKLKEEVQQEMIRVGQHLDNNLSKEDSAINNILANAADNSTVIDFTQYKNNKEGK